jgi:murein endopeptidase
MLYGASRGTRTGKPARSLLVGDCSLPCGSAMLRVAHSHQFAYA